TEQLNATEVLKRGLHKVLPHLLGIPEKDIAASYPDLTSGVAGYLKVNAGDTRHKLNFEKACQAIVNKYPELETTLTEMRGKWGIPWIDKNQNPKKYHPRLLNADWILEDLPNSTELKEEYRREINNIISDSYPSNNPSDWYVLAAGDGDSMSEWLKGTKLKTYGDYIPSKLSVNLESFPQFLEIQKRMGP
ncbi:MAG: type III-B CRISPR-associated protein Cas10/Cmr2, partial [Sphaerospermopsis kisseleviana]